MDCWLDVAPLENMKDDYGFLFFVANKNLMKIFLGTFEKKNLKDLEILNFFERIENLDWFFFFFFFLKQPKKHKTNGPSPKAFWKLSLFFFWNMKICLLSKSEEDEDLFMMIFYFLFLKTYPLNENNFSWKLMWIPG